MIKQTITYTDFNGEQRTNDFYFHLSKAELARQQLNYSQDNGFAEYLQKIMDAKNGRAIMDSFEEIINMSYGVRTPDGRFEKTPDHLLQFRSSNAYNELFMRLITDTAFASAFVNGLVPPELAAEAAALRAEKETEQKEQAPATTPDVQAQVDGSQTIPVATYAPDIPPTLPMTEGNPSAYPEQAYRPRAEDGYQQ